MPEGIFRMAVVVLLAVVAIEGVLLLLELRETHRHVSAALARIDVDLDQP